MDGPGQCLIEDFVVSWSRLPQSFVRIFMPSFSSSRDVDSERACKALHKHGYSFIRSHRPELSCLEASRLIGKPVSISRTRSSHNSMVQILTPTRCMEAKTGTYSEVFGLGAFPFHTDLAHWAIPPRYVLLRCIAGHPATETSVLEVGQLVDKIGALVLERAMLRPRKAGSSGFRCLLPAVLRRVPIRLRWDPLFLDPVNASAEVLKTAMASAHQWARPVVQRLVARGDTLVLDNWRVLHGRGAIDVQSLSLRRIERVYLSEVY